MISAEYIDNNSCQMLQVKRRSTLDSSQKTRKNKITEYLFELDKCMQIPNDDKLILRRQLKDNENSVMAIFDQFKKEKSYAELQVKLRKYVQGYKNQVKRNITLNNEKENIYKDHQRIYSQNSQQNSYKNSLKGSPEKEEAKKKVITLDIAQLKQKIQSSMSHRSFAHVSKNLMVPTPRKDSEEERRDISITKVKPYLPEKQESNSRSRSFLKSYEKDAHNDSSNSLAFSRNPSKSKLLSQEKSKKDLSKITIRISSKPSLENSLYKGQVSGQSRTLEDLTNQVSYSSSIKNLLTAKFKDQKQYNRRNEKIYIREDTQNSQDENSLPNFLPKTYRDDKPTVIKRPAKPLHRDEQLSCQMKLFDDSVPVYLKASEYAVPKEEPSIFTVRDDAAIKIIEQQDAPTPFKFEYNFKQPQLHQNSQEKIQKNSRFEPEEVIDESHFFRKIKKIMQDTNF